MRTFPMAALVRPGQSQPRPSEDSPANYKSMSDEVHRPATPEKAGRSSFSSLRENDSNLVQAFTLSKTSSYLVTNEAAVEESPLPANDMVEAQFCPPVTQHYSRLHGYWAPADTFKGWKQINVKGKLASKSFGDLQVLNSAWTNAAVPHRPGGACAPGDAPIERLPIELLGSIINLLVLDIPPNGIARRNVDLMSLLLTSKTLHLATLNTLYSKITIPHSRIFQKFLAHVSTHESLGTIVRRLDFCHFNPSQLFSTASERSQARNLTSETLLQCLDLTPYLQEFLAQEYIEDDLDGNVLQKLFFGLPRLQAVDFCGCSSAHFKDAFSSILQLDWPTQLSIRRLSMHKCMTLPSSVFETVLPRLANLTHLDVAGTRITDEALASIPATAKITHLNLSKCRQLTAVNVIKFLATHPAVRSTLTFLSLATDARSHQLFDVEDVAELLPVLPPTLKSLSLRGSKMDKSHIDLLIPLTKHLEELAVGRCLKLEDINKLFLPDETQGIEGQLEWVPQALRYIDVSDLWGSDLDLGFLFGNHCAMLKRFSEPLEVIELADDAIKRLTKSPMILQRAGWRISECGSRSWLVRQESDGRRNDGRRPWKMGAEAWGMRKIPVARAEVGGMYGSFMFSRRL